jgi:hypothetical protein
MVQTAGEYLDEVAALFSAAFAQVRIVERDDRPERCLLEMVGLHGPYRVRLSEVVIAGGGRKYAYYVLKGDEVVVGFDNAPDPQVLKLKYGAEYKAHILERVPHSHTDNKTKPALTEEMDCAGFIAWVRRNL